MSDPIQEFTAPHVVVNDVTMRAPPGGLLGSNETRRQTRRIDEPAPAHEPGEMRTFRAEQAGAHGRVDAVGTDHNVGFDLAAVGKVRDGAARAGGHVGAARRESKAALRHELAQHFLHVAAMDRAAGGAEMRAVACKRVAQNHPAAMPATHALAFRLERFGKHAGLEPERAQRRERVWGEHDAAAELAQARRLLVDGDVHAAHQERAGCRQPADPSPNDGDT